MYHEHLKINLNKGLIIQCSKKEEKKTHTHTLCNAKRYDSDEK